MNSFKNICLVLSLSLALGVAGSHLAYAKSGGGDEKELKKLKSDLKKAKKKAKKLEKKHEEEILALTARLKAEALKAIKAEKAACVASHSSGGGGGGGGASPSPSPSASTTGVTTSASGVDATVGGTTNTVNY